MTLNTPILWVLLPLLVAVVTGVLYQRRESGILITIITAFGLSLLAAFFPESMEMSIGPIELIFEDSLGLLGRQITLRYEILPFISFLYAVTGLWTLGSGIPGVPITFRPISLVITALLTATLGVQPFLYAALLIQTAVMVSIPILSTGDPDENPGLMRYLGLQTLAMPLILLAGWLLAGVEILPPDSALVFQTIMVLGLGFALMMGVFPFHTWIPMISRRGHPKVVSYLLFILPTTMVIFGLNFLNRYAFLRGTPEIFDTLRLSGVLMIVIGGAWTAVQGDIKRAFGFAVISETGFSLLAAGLLREGGLTWLMVLLPVRALGFWLWSHSITLIEQRVDSLSSTDLSGLARRFPVLAIGLLGAQLSIAGLPLLASFPFKFSIISATIELQNSLGTWAFIGNLGLFIFSIRLLARFVSPDSSEFTFGWQVLEQKHEFISIVLMLLVLIILGLFPSAFPSRITQVLSAFSQLQ